MNIGIISKAMLGKLLKLMCFTERTDTILNWKRAANPLLDLSVAKSDFKCSNLILNVVYMVLLCSSISWKHAPEQLSNIWLQKCLCLNYIQMLWRWHLTTHKMGNIQGISCCFSFVDVTLPVNAQLNVVHFAMSNRKVPRSRRCTSHAGCSALIVQCTKTFL